MPEHSLKSVMAHALTEFGLLRVPIPHGLPETGRISVNRLYIPGE